MVVKKPSKDGSVNIMDLINKGAPTKPETHKEIKWTFINIRAPVDLIEKVDEAIKKRYGMPRVAWILEAMKEKLKREQENDD